MHQTRVFAGILVVAIIVSGATVYYAQEQKHAEERAAMIAQIDELSSEVRQFQEVLKVNEVVEECNDLNTDPANETVVYSNPEKGIAVELPYNKQWGYGENIPDPYLELSKLDGILFGVPEPMDTCQWAHSYQMTILPSRNQDTITQDVLERNAMNKDATPKLFSLSGFTVYRYELPAYCPTKNYEVVGKKYNYIFTTCKGSEEVLKNIISSVELL